jgi:hypothetical protein
MRVKINRHCRVSGSAGRGHSSKPQLQPQLTDLGVANPQAARRLALPMRPSPSKVYRPPTGATEEGTSPTAMLEPTAPTYTEVILAAVPPACHSQRSWPVPSGQPGTTPQRPRPVPSSTGGGDDPSQSGFASRRSGRYASSDAPPVGGRTSRDGLSNSRATVRTASALCAGITWV